MKAKLTLSVDKDLVQFARSQAHADKKSVSGMFSDYLRHRQAQRSKTVAPTVAAMLGSLRQYQINDSKQAVRAGYAQKYSR